MIDAFSGSVDVGTFPLRDDRSELHLTSAIMPALANHQAPNATPMLAAVCRRLCKKPLHHILRKCAPVARNYNGTLSAPTRAVAYRPKPEPS